MIKKKRKSLSLQREYSESWKYLKESRNFIYFIVGVFLISALIGFFIPAPQGIVEKILEFVKKLIEQTEGMSQGQLIKFIFFNNLQSSFFGLILGFVLGIFPIIASAANGYLLGFVGSMAVQEGGILVLWRLLPHGIFELPAIFISLGMGLKFGTFLFQKKKINSFKKFIFNGLRVFIFIVIPLLVVAAIIEGSLILLIG